MHNFIQNENIQLTNFNSALRYKMLFCMLKFRIIRIAEVYSEPRQISKIGILCEKN